MATNNSENTEKTLLEIAKDYFVSVGGTLLWESATKDKAIILRSGFLPDFVILTRCGFGVRLAFVDGTSDANGLPARVYYDESFFEIRE